MVADESLVCVLCLVNATVVALGTEDEREPYPHQHHADAVPLTPCLSCFIGAHDKCQPTGPFYCACDCGLKGET